MGRERDVSWCAWCGSPALPTCGNNHAGRQPAPPSAITFEVEYSRERVEALGAGRPECTYWGRTYEFVKVEKRAGRLIYTFVLPADGAPE